MIIKDLCCRLSITTAVIAAVIASSHTAFAGTRNVKGSEAGSFITANFSYNGAGPGLVSTFSGNDNIGGPFNGQELSQASVSTGSCTAPDGSAGTPFVLVHASEIDTYNRGQLFLDGTVGTECASNSTGSVGATLTLPVVFGTGKFANASGSITQTFTCGVLAVGEAAPNTSLGLFGGCQVTRTGSVTD